MAALTPLDNSSLSVDLSSSTSDVYQNQEYSLFSDYLSPLTQDQHQGYELNTPSSEKTTPNADSHEQKAVKLNAHSGEAQPNKEPKPAATIDARKPRALKSNPHVKAQNSTIQKEVNTQNSQPTEVQPPLVNTAHSDDEALNALKENVKNILKNISTSPSATKHKKQSPQPKGIKLQVEETAEVRLSTKKTEKSIKPPPQTTVAHLSSRNNQQANNDATHILPLEEHLQNLNRTEKNGAPKVPSIQHHVIQELSLNPTTRKARTVKKGRTEQLSSTNRGKQQTSFNKENVLPRFIPLDKIADSSSNLLVPQDRTEIQSQLMDKVSAESDGNPSQLGKGTAKTHLNKSTGTKSPQVARAARATQWLKVLSERTSLLDKTNPHWKVLEMKLDKGNGSMTVQVMKEEDFVSVAVNFSDPEVRALAETQYQDILRDLEQQYQKEVRFTFNEQGASSFESYSSPMQQRSNRQPLSHTINKPTQEPPEQTSHSSGDGQVWIG